LEEAEPAPLPVDSIFYEINNYKNMCLPRVALEFRLPIALKELREHAQHGIEQARKTHDAKSGRVKWVTYAAVRK
jgi:hypothetical protein